MALSRFNIEIYHSVLMDEEKKATQDVPSVGSSQEDVRPLVVVPPDGGLKAWMQVLGSWFLFFNSW